MLIPAPDTSDTTRPSSEERSTIRRTHRCPVVPEQGACASGTMGHPQRQGRPAHDDPKLSQAGVETADRPFAEAVGGGPGQSDSGGVPAGDGVEVSEIGCEVGVALAVPGTRPVGGPGERDCALPPHPSEGVWFGIPAGGRGGGGQHAGHDTRFSRFRHSLFGRGSRHPDAAGIVGTWPTCRASATAAAKAGEDFTQRQAVSRRTPAAAAASPWAQPSRSLEIRTRCVHVMGGDYPNSRRSVHPARPGAGAVLLPGAATAVPTIRRATQRRGRGSFNGAGGGVLAARQQWKGFQRKLHSFQRITLQYGATH
jgi:hypothetical protein